MSQAAHPRPTNIGVLHELDAAQVLALLSARQVVLIDVREPGESEAQRIPASLLSRLSGSNQAHLPLTSFDPASGCVHHGRL